MAYCALVAKGIVQQKGKPSIEFYKDNKPQYYCMGYKDLRTEMPYEECTECKRWYLGEQCEKDFEEELERRKERHHEID